MFYYNLYNYIKINFLILNVVILIQFIIFICIISCKNFIVKRRVNNIRNKRLLCQWIFIGCNATVCENVLVSFNKFLAAGEVDISCWTHCTLQYYYHHTNFTFQRTSMRGWNWKWHQGTMQQTISRQRFNAPPNRNTLVHSVY